ncbi:hypothetical protein VW29_06515 [Devosia limi DSM 17137]|nr:hypothetical protein VW29_06515 [Devosia limi DSM 17137]
MPVQAQYWTHYENDAFGYEIDIPPGYENYMDSADGNGAVFMLVGMQQELTVWGEALEADSGDFTDAAQRALDSDIADGWAITYQVATPDWASWSGVKDGQVLYRRMIILCDRQSHASFRSVYPSQDLPGMHPVLEGLVRSFVPTAC